MEVTRLVPETQIVTAEVTRLVPETQVVTAEVTRTVRETQIITVEVTRVGQRDVIVTATLIPRPALVITQSANLQKPRAHHTATRLHNGRILLVGGSQAPDEQLVDVELFDPASGGTIPAAPMHTARHDHSATLLRDGRVLVVCGYNATQQWIADAEIYNPAANQWTVIPPLFPHGVQHTATLLNDGRVLVVGGCIGSGVCTGKVELFDPQANQWIETASLPSDRASHTAQVLQDGRVLIAGGGGAATGVPAGGDALLFEPSGNSWTAAGRMIAPRLFSQSTRLADGRILVVGGTTLVPEPVIRVVPGVEIYDPSSNEWTSAGTLAQGRYSFILASLPDGHILAIGGARNYGVVWNDGSFVREIELYDPQINVWTTVGEVQQLGVNLAGAVLDDGHIWVAGGQGGNSREQFWKESWLIGLKFSQP